MNKPKAADARKCRPTHINLPVALRSAIDAYVRRRKTGYTLSQFMREAAADKLHRPHLSETAPPGRPRKDPDDG